MIGMETPRILQNIQDSILYMKSDHLNFRIAASNVLAHKVKYFLTKPMLFKGHPAKAVRVMNPE